MEPQSETSGIAGLGTALVTPFTAGGRNFLVALGSTGEASTLAEAEQLRIAEIVLKVAGARVPVVVGCTHNDTAAVVRRGLKFAALGVRHLLSASPFYNRPTQEGIYRHFRALRDATRLNLLAYTIPARTGGNILPETVARLVEDGIIFGLKEASGSILQIQDICRRVNGACALLSGDDAMTLPVMAVGGAGVIATASNAIPGAMRAWVDAIAGRDPARAREPRRRLLPLFDACGVEPNPIPIKAGLSLMGLMEAHYRLPLVPPAAETVARMKQALAPFLA